MTSAATRPEPASPKPYRLCGCFHVATEEQAAVVQQIARDVLGGKGFAVDYEGQDEDGLGVTMVVLP
jgi:hypothetical protein